MTSSAPEAAQIMQATSDFHNRVRQSFGGVTELILGDATDFYSSDRVLDAHAYPRQMAIVPFLGRRQRVLL
jgi:hypothetical protein